MLCHHTLPTSASLSAGHCHLVFTKERDESFISIIIITHNHDQVCKVYNSKIVFDKLQFQNLCLAEDENVDFVILMPQ